MGGKIGWRELQTIPVGAGAEQSEGPLTIGLGDLKLLFGGWSFFGIAGAPTSNGGAAMRWWIRHLMVGLFAILPRSTVSEIGAGICIRLSIKLNTMASI